MQGIAVFQGKLEGGYVTFFQDDSHSPVKINVHVKHLSPGKHGFHIHEKGNLLSIINGDYTKCSIVK